MTDGTRHGQIADSEPKQIYLRGFAEEKDGTLNKTEQFSKGRGSPRPSEWALIFDTETTTDSAQRLRIGSYQVRKSDKLKEQGLFYDEAALSASEVATLRRFTKDNRFVLRTHTEFLEQIFLDVGYWLRATIIGFNLPFDISRIAISHAPARGNMRGGFSFQLSSSSREPRLQVKHLSARAALMRFTHPGRQLTGRGNRRRGISVKPHRGYFVDVKTLAASLTSKSHTLAGLTSHLKSKTRKVESERHGEALTIDYLGYAAADVQATWECFKELSRKYEAHGLEGTPAYLIKSEASIGKAYLKEMGVRPWREVQPDFPPAEIGQIMSAYCGGRSEVRIRRTITEVEYCDFLSMYPTVCTLMSLWKFVISDGVTQRDSTEEVRQFLETACIGDLQRPDTWKMLRTLVRVQPDADILPVRARYGHEAQKTIGLNFLTSNVPLWFTLSDCIASKLLSGKAPKVVEAISFAQGQDQSGLRAVQVGGEHGTLINPTAHDFYRTLIDQRTTLKTKLKEASEQEREVLDAEQMAVKILANSTSYGIFIEVNVEAAAVTQELTCHGFDGRSFGVRKAKVEKPGKYFHPLLAVLITGAARLMLAITERLATDKGLEWVFCDTDSMALARAGGMAQKVFYSRAREVREWFKPLNPYAVKGDLLKQEDANFAIKSEPQQRQPLYCFAISAKRYALFNIGEDGRPQIRKASAHGLGHFMPPYRDGDGPSDIPAPPVRLSEVGVDRWQYDLWYRIVHAAVEGAPDQPRLDLHRSFAKPAMSRYAATTPELLAWFKRHNVDRPYTDQVRPFGFLAGLHAQSGAHPVDTDLRDASRGRAWRPVAPFNRDPSAAACQAFDRETGWAIPQSALKTYQEAVAQYHLHPEAKFHHGDYTDRGPTQRRHVLVTSVAHIGKEADRLEEQFFLGASPDAEVEYGADSSIGPDDFRAIPMGIREFGQAKVACAARMSLRDVSAAARHPKTIRPIHAQRLKCALATLSRHRGL